MNNIEFKSLGREIKISPKSLMAIETLPDGNKEATVEVKIGDGIATLKMDNTAIKALKVGEAVRVTTAKQFRNKVK